jgi:predicted exporter
MRHAVAPRTAVFAWLAFMAICAGWLYRNLAIGTDMTAFLPPTTTPAQKLLVDQLRDGVASRLILIALEGAPPPELASASRQVAVRLRSSGMFGLVSNGDLAGAAKERALLERHRYLLSPGVTAERFSAAGLATALKEALALFASPAGPLVRSSLPYDPTGESRRILELLVPESGPPIEHGVWFSSERTRALLLAETRAPGFDIDAQARAIETIRDAVRAATPAGELKLLMSGTGVFGVDARATIQAEARWLSAAAGVLVLLILVFVYRAVAPIALTMVPLASGLVAGIAAVSYTHGVVHGITLGFGATLIGEVVDYSSYAFLQARPRERLGDALARIGPTLRLAVLTTIFGASAMALSSFHGLAQLGLLTIVGVGVAGLTTRWVLPALAPAGAGAASTHELPFGFARTAKPEQGSRLAAGSGAHGTPYAVAIAVAAAVAIIAWKHDRIWDDDLANLSPISAEAKALDTVLRAQLGAPDVRYLLVLRADEREALLEASEAAERWLDRAVTSGLIAGYDLPSKYLPSRKAQETRRAALPDAASLADNLEQAMRATPFREGLFEPFQQAVEQARSGPLVSAETLQGSAFGLKIDTLLLHPAPGWAALIPVRGVIDGSRLAALAREGGAELIDLKVEANALVSGYRNESLRLITAGLAAIAILLAWGLRSIGRAASVLAPVLAAVVLDIAMLLAAGVRLTLFHLVALLLVVGIGLNYALFFNRPAADPVERSRTLLALIVCWATTLVAFGCLALSQTPVLKAIGVTVALGTVLSFAIAAALADPRPSPLRRG